MLPNNFVYLYKSACVGRSFFVQFNRKTERVFVKKTAKFAWTESIRAVK